MHCTTANYTTS